MTEATRSDDPYLAVLGESGWRLLLFAGMAVDDHPDDALAAATALAKRASDDPAPHRAAALELVVQGRRLADKLGLDERLLATREAVEQATRGRVATWHAQRVPACERLVEIGCGCGGDSLALAHRVRNLVATDLDPVRAACTHLNLLAVGLGSSRAVPGDGLSLLEGELSRADAVFLDPARRSDGARTRDPESWSPPLSAIRRLVADGRSVFAKLGPTLDADDVGGALDVWFVSHAGECVEAFVEPRAGDVAQVGAVLLPGDGPAVHLTGERGPAPVAAVDDVLHTVDPAAIRAGLLGELAARHDLGVVRPGLAWLAGGDVVASPWLRSHVVLRRAALSEVPALLDELGAGDVRVRLRGHPATSDELHRAWRRRLGRGGPTFDVFVTRTEDGDRAWVARPTEETA